MICLLSTCTNKSTTRYLCLSMGWDITDSKKYIKPSKVSELDRRWIDSLRIGATKRNPKDYINEEVCDSILIKNPTKKAKFFSSDTFIKYNQIVNGYEIKVGNVGDSCVWFFKNIETGKTIYHHDVAFSILYQYLCVSTNQIEEEYHLFHLDYKECLPEENGGYFIKNKSLFQFADVDFDGEDEILFSLFTNNKEGDLYRTYDIVGDSLILLDYPPFNNFYTHRAKIFPKKKQIRLYENAGCSYVSNLVFTKHEEWVNNVSNFPDIELMPSYHTIKEYAKIKKVLFTLDSIFYYHPTYSYDVMQTDTFAFSYVNNTDQQAVTVSYLNH